MHVYYHTVIIYCNVKIEVFPASTIVVIVLKTDNSRFLTGKNKINFLNTLYLIWMLERKRNVASVKTKFLFVTVQPSRYSTSDKLEECLTSILCYRVMQFFENRSVYLICFIANIYVVYFFSFTRNRFRRTKRHQNCIAFKLITQSGYNKTLIFF